MATRRKTTPQDTERRARRATTPEGRENQIIAAAYDLAEAQILDGTASSQTIGWFLKLGSSREKLEQERIRNENKLIGAKIELMEQGQKIEALYYDALNAMRSYKGEDPLEIEGEVAN